ncbi:hypothetical protein GCM10010361_14990 [Streptomyces olivaceiscleroticus]|uniref:Transposase IS30-like HTH domain-containing protein n=1 Tax=Streptomyces olivaceiscleroticus TaxID=68245 RepID=A0ABP3JF83_9ACTN
MARHNEGPARTLEFQWSLQHPSSGDAEDFEIRGDRTAQGPAELSRERAEYSRLMRQGYSNKEACRVVGINARAGRKWRNDRSADRRQKAAPPTDAVVPPSGPSRYLSEADRIYIADRLREKATVRAIAAELGRSPSTTSREIHRNRTAGARGRRHYRPHAAQARADARRLPPSRGRSDRTPSCGSSSRSGSASGRPARRRNSTMSMPLWARSRMVPSMWTRRPPVPVGGW